MQTHYPERTDGLRVPSTVHPASRIPAAFRALECRGNKYPDEWHCLTFIPGRGFIEPRTNRMAEPVLGHIFEWCYVYPDKKDW